MQLLPILLVATLLARDVMDHPGVPLAPRDAALVAIGAQAMIVAMAAVGFRLSRRRLDGGAAERGLRIADRTAALGRAGVLVAHAVAVLVFGWLDAVRAALGGDLVGLDELVAILPACLGLAGLFAVQYPVERRIRHALLIRQLDSGQAIYRTPSRSRFVWTQMRTNVLFLLVPVLAILAGGEGIRAVLDRADVRTPWLTECAALAVGLLVFTCAPFIARVVLTVEPLPQGPLRDDLLAVCRAHAVRVRDLLLWRTDGSMINAAVMGLIGHMRYVLLTDALLDLMPRLQLQAVMAHEIGHVRRRHLPWLAVALLAVILLVTTLVTLPLAVFDARVPPERAWILDLGATAGSLIAALVVFGWVSRRFERQADTFAVVHLSRSGDGSAGDGEPVVAPLAVATMCGALGSIARLNSIDPRRRSWRHGSIAWRQAYLASIVGDRIGALEIDRLIRRIKVAALIVFVIGVGAVVLLEQQAATDSDAAGRTALSAISGSMTE